MYNFTHLLMAERPPGRPARPPQICPLRHCNACDKLIHTHGLQSLCPGCQALARAQHSLAYYHAIAKDRNISRRETLGYNCIAHCGQWHAITAIPQQLTCCGYILTYQECAA